VELLRLDLRLVSVILSRQVKVIAFCDCRLLPNLLEDWLPKFWECWLPVSRLVVSHNSRFAQK
jgi:hypothetical protein